MEKANLSKFKVLVAEDEMFQRLALIEYMDISGYETVSVENGRLALEELRKPENVFDMVLLDLQMPEMNGFELLELMQTDEKLRGIPVVVMSANESQSIVSRCLGKFCAE
jgi:CheY-like chemotaxis protein